MHYPKPAESHFIIGLTGNIGTGKSLVRKMLEHSGALGIDADHLTRDLLKEGSPASKQVIAQFGNKIIGARGEIDRKKLGEIVFSDPQALKTLESILHPLISAAVKNIIALSPLPVVVIEAIKLLESDLVKQCQSIWVVNAEPEEVYKRLEISRGMPRAQVELRLAQQSSAAEKIQQADIVIHNSAGTDSTWQQVQSAWESIIESDKNASGQFELPAGLNFLPPSQPNLDLLGNFLVIHPHSAVNRYLKEAMEKFFKKDMNKNWPMGRGMLFQSLLDYYFVQGAETGLAFWDMNHFSCQLGAYHIKQSGKAHELENLITSMENFGKLHLCSTFSIPFNKEDATFYEVMGYHIQPTQNARRQVSSKAGYNQYIKTYPSAFKLYEA